MKNIRTFCSTALGESHGTTNKVCQDSSACFEDAEKELFICAVSDGHGGDMYFRSDRGSKLLVEITIKVIRQFIENADNDLFNVPFTEIPARTTEIKEKIDRKVTSQDDAFRLLFSSIISQWNDGIAIDWSEDPPSKELMQAAKVPETAIESFIEGKGIEFAYGCTLIAFCRTLEFWFAFQLGDGKCIAFDKDAKWNEPIPWDEQCNGSTTTSTCESNPIDNLRYCYGNNKFPVALFIGSDGMDGAYGSTDDLALFYCEILKSFIKNGYEKTVKEIDDSLPLLSSRGISRDDMSVAGVIDLDGIRVLLPVFAKKDLERVQKEFEIAEESYSKNEEIVLEKESELKKKQSEVASLNRIISEYKETIANADAILAVTIEDLKKKDLEVHQSEDDFRHAQSVLARAGEERKVSHNKLESIKKEIKDLNEDDLRIPKSEADMQEVSDRSDANLEIKRGSSSDKEKGFFQNIKKIF
jgi:hypothetical protein